MSEQSREELLAKIEQLEQKLAAQKTDERPTDIDNDVHDSAAVSGGQNQLDASRSTFGQTNQQVGQQVNVAGSLVMSAQVAAGLTTLLQAASTQDLQPVTERYLTHLVSRYHFLDFKGMGMADRVALQLPLVEMYVPLQARIEMPKGETWVRELRIGGRQVSEEEAQAMGERLSAPTSLIELLAHHDGLVILGDPGAGKTTFLKYLTLGQGQDLKLAGRLPILVPLSSYANALA